jgi:RsiW-degrading membrane proteinase PrsW (M82 family)
MERERCGRCGRDLGAGREGVYYCENCLRTAARAGSAGLWWATVAALVLMVGGGVALAIAGKNIALGEHQRLLVGLGLTIVPALLWLALFYMQDRLEPEPHSYVLAIFILGILLGGAIQQPLVRDIFKVQDWVDIRQPGVFIAVVTLLKGILTAALTYFAVRFTVMPTAEFDERVDGIVYGTAAALGLGVAANMHYLLDQGTISLGVGALQIIITSLAYATFGAIVGYFLGLIKPGGGSSMLAPVAVIVTGAIHGAYEFVETWLPTKSGNILDGYSPWPSLTATAVFAALAFGVVFFLISRSYRAMVMIPEGKA